MNKNCLNSRIPAGMQVQAYNPSTWEAEAEGLCVQDQPGLHGHDPLSKTNK
jgi:hypothetical protein